VNERPMANDTFDYEFRFRPQIALDDATQVGRS
jgi:hypothetical protein